MATEVKNVDELTEPMIRGKKLIADTDATMMTFIDFGEYGHFATDEPIAHGGTGEGPSPLHTVLGALCGCEAVTFRRTATDFRLLLRQDRVRGGVHDRYSRPYGETRCSGSLSDREAPGHRDDRRK